MQTCRYIITTTKAQMELFEQQRECGEHYGGGRAETERKADPVAHDFFRAAAVLLLVPSDGLATELTGTAARMVTGLEHVNQTAGDGESVVE